jgi:uncharacterized protein (DUF305 family)
VKGLSRRMLAPGLLAILVITGCRRTPRVVEPVSGRPTVEVSSNTVRPRHTAADVRFMQGMIHHHAQALAMTSLVPTRTRRDDMRLLAERIDVSQRDEIRLMEQWLRSRHEEVPTLDAHHGHHDAASHSALMPGMLTEDELARLAQATGPEFDRLFLQDMIRHHEGALTMVSELFGSSGAAQESETYRFASDVDSDQRAEITRMRALLQSLPAGGPSR